MAAAKEKRYEEISFDPPANWTCSVGADGARTWTNTGPGASSCTITKPSGAEQLHNSIPQGKATIRVSGGDVTVQIAP